MGRRTHQQLTCSLLFSLFSVLAADWSVFVPDGPICAVVGSFVVLPCSYDYPRASKESKGEGGLAAQGGVMKQELEYKVLSEMWCLEDSKCITERYVFHSAGIFQHPSYSNRVQYLGQPGTRNCSLKISDLRLSDTGTYVFYFTTSHPTEKAPEQSGIQLLVTDSPRGIVAAASPGCAATEGTTLRLACCTPGSPSQTFFRWYKNPHTTAAHVGQVWSIDNITPAESGSYHCQIQTEDAELNSTVVIIDVQYPPRNMFLSVLEDTLPATLSCSSDANPPAHSYIWYEGEACATTADKSAFQGTWTSATVTEGGYTASSATLTVKERGEHCCVAINSRGSRVHTMTLGSKENTALIIGVCVGLLLALLAIVAFVVTRKRGSARHHSYALSVTNSKNEDTVN